MPRESGVEPLLAAAAAAQSHAYAPYSGYPVGGGGAGGEWRRYRGCNGNPNAVENVSYGLTICAERSAVFAVFAIFAAVAAGERRIEAIATRSERPAPPCGACLQVLAEFGDPDRLTVILGNPAGARRLFRLRELCPHPFDRRSLGFS